MSDDAFMALLLATCAAFVLAMAVVMTFFARDNFWQAEAMRHHAATYYLDANNQRQWRWNDELEAKP